MALSSIPVVPLLPQHADHLFFSIAEDEDDEEVLSANDDEEDNQQLDEADEEAWVGGSGYIELLHEMDVLGAGADKEDLEPDIPSVQDILSQLDREEEDITTRIAAVEAKARGDVAFRSGSFGDAIEHLTESLRLDPSNQFSRHLLDISNLCAWDEAGVPVFRLNDHRAAEELAWHYRKPAAEAKFEGSAAFRAGRYGAAITHLREALRLDASDAIARRLLHLSILREWEAQGIPVLRLADLKAAIQLVEQSNKIDRMSKADLLEWYRGEGFPEESCLTKSDLAKLSKLVALWQRLPLAELYRECAQRKVPFSQWVQAEDSKQQRLDLVKKLLVQERMDAWESMGFQANRIGSAAAVMQVVEQSERLGQMARTELLDEFSQLGFPEEIHIRKRDLVSLLRMRAEWRVLPLAELQKECVDHGLSIDSILLIGSSKEKRRQLVNKLCWHSRMEAWEADGIKAHQIGDPEAVVYVVNMYNSVHSLPWEDLLDWYTRCGFPNQQCLNRADVEQLFKQVLVWQHLPAEELRKELAERGLESDQNKISDDSKGERQMLADKLMVEQQMDIWEANGIQARRIGNAEAVIQYIERAEVAQQQSKAELLEWYLKLGLPEERDMESAEIAELSKDVLLWNALPLPELRKECEERQLPIDENFEVGGSMQRREALMQELLFHQRMISWEAKGYQAKRLSRIELVQQVVSRYEIMRGLNDSELWEEYEAFGLPKWDGMERQDLLEAFRIALTWELLPVHELQQECANRGLLKHSHRLFNNAKERRRALIQWLRGGLRTIATAASDFGPGAGLQMPFGSPD